MALTYKLGTEEIGTDEATGILSGDTDPGTTQDGTITRLALADEEIATDYEASAGDFDDHDHSAAGQKLGSKGRALATGAIITAKIDDLAVTGAKIATGAVTTAKIDDGAVTEAKLGDAAEHDFGTVAAGATVTWTHNYGIVLFGHIETPETAGVGDCLGEFMAVALTINAVSVYNGSGDACPARYVYRGGI